MSLAERDAALDKLDKNLALGVPPALLLATLAAYVLAAAALRPVERMRARAATISTDEISTRLPLPGSEDEVRRLGVTLNAMLDRLEEGLTHERLFIANASHELRMPLAVLKAELEVSLRERGTAAQLRAAIGSAIEETDRIVKLAEDLLLLARAEDGSLPIAATDLPIGELLFDLGERFSPIVGDARRALVVGDSSGLPGVAVHADPARLLQAVGNLIDNTLRYGDGTITISAAVAGDRAEIHVCDEGAGFTQWLLPRAFDRFSRADPARQRGGVGLGLAVVQMIAHAHGGQAGARNRPAGGADVWISLPVSQARRSGSPCGRSASSLSRTPAPCKIRPAVVVGRLARPYRRSAMTSATTAAPRPGAAHALTKVPEITAVFWALKLLTTGMGEAMSDFLGQQSVPAAALIGIVGIVVALRLQLRQAEYRAAYYWFAVMMVAIFGTMAADGIRDGAGLGYTVTTPLFAVITAAIFARWYRSEGTLSIHSITTARRERFYWAAVLATFALGTAAGDLTAIAFKLGFFPSVLVFAAIIAVPAVGWWRFHMNPIVAFWCAYIVTRPLGASFADWFSKPRNGGLGAGDGIVSAIELVVFVGLVAYVAITKCDVQRARRVHHTDARIGRLAVEPE